MSMLGTLPVVAEELLKKVRQVYQEQSQLTDELLLALKFVFGPAALHALELVDRRSVTLVQSPSGRSLYQAPAPSSRSRCCCNQKWKAPTLEVEGSSGQVYHCLSFCLYCSCPAFMYSVLRRNDNILIADKMARKKLS
ncbi:zinc finger SWIM domain-containing protein 7 isoform X5 [Stegostoma tigrinum]|uniref:zinc finger SWIM domain-containing protein 7 isoform X5 n=1 Tax=Stegostoma tigrinum TaxID=3053191 RepID=UPI00286FFFA7|nr:zinc finger SWIM domain-containing protein 7 isoform X5 [Stegostoma tigrinum]